MSDVASLDLDTLSSYSRAPVVALNTDQEIAAWVMLEHGEGSLALRDNHGVFLGLIAAQRMLSVLMQEHEEDLWRFSGLLATGNTAQITRGAGCSTPHPPTVMAYSRAARRDDVSLARRFLGRQLARTVQLAFFPRAIVTWSSPLAHQSVRARA